MILLVGMGIPAHRLGSIVGHSFASSHQRGRKEGLEAGSAP